MSTDIQKIQENISKIDTKNLTKEQIDEFVKLQKMIAEGEVSKKELELLVSTIPNFVELEKIYIDGLKKIADNAKDSQKEAIAGIIKSLDNAYKILDGISNKTDNEELLSKIADLVINLSEKSIQLAEITKDMNENNNNFWENLTKYAGIGLVVITAISSILLSQKKDQNA